MKISLRLFLLFCAAVSASFVACAGRRHAPYRPLVFEWADQRDTADFVHIRPENQPISVELFANTDSLTDSTYVVHVQVGVYGSPEFSPEFLSIKDSTVTATANGLEATKAISIGSCCGDSTMKPWVALSNHWFVFDRDSLAERTAQDGVLRILVDFDGYATYGDRPVEIEPATMLDPWFNRFTAAVKKEE
ncbi:MAG: hypothetical protein PVH24_05160 [Candidatus Zixiibacteriota bacterium]|jgi:hypothetical protein